MEEILKIIIQKSPSASTLAIRALRALQNNSPVSQKRYNRVAEIALQDAQAIFSAEERETITNYIQMENSDSRGVDLHLRLSYSESAALQADAKANNMTISAYVRYKLFNKKEGESASIQPD